jgi:hypothetical protein
MSKTTLAASAYLAASPTKIGGNAARRHAQTQGRGLFNARLAQFILCAIHEFMYHEEYY